MTNFLIAISDFLNSLATTTGISAFSSIGDAVRAPADKVLNAKSKINTHQVNARATMSQANGIKKAAPVSKDQNKTEEEKKRAA